MLMTLCLMPCPIGYSSIFPSGLHRENNAESDLTFCEKQNPDPAQESFLGAPSFILSPHCCHFAVSSRLLGDLLMACLTCDLNCAHSLNRSACKQIFCGGVAIRSGSVPQHKVYPTNFSKTCMITLQLSVAIWHID